MKKLLFVTATTLLGASLTPWGQAAPARHIPDYFPIRVGYWWKYRVTAKTGTSEYTIKVIKQDKDRFELETMSALAIDDWYSKPSGWVLINHTEYPKNKMAADYKPARQLLKNPLSVGDKWEWKGTGMMGVEMQEENSVGPDASVSVPAGKFSARHVTTLVHQGGAEVNKSYFYVDGVGLVKSQTSSGGVTSVCELVDYSFRPKR